MIWTTGYAVAKIAICASFSATRFDEGGTGVIGWCMTRLSLAVYIQRFVNLLYHLLVF